MPAEGEQVNPQPSGSEGHFQKPLHGVCVEQNLLVIGFDQRRRLLYRQDTAQLVVHQHHGHQHRVRPQGGFEIVQGDLPLPVRHQVGHFPPFCLHLMAGLQNGGVFKGSGDDVTPFAAVFLCAQPQRPVVTLGAAGGEHHLGRLAAQGVRYRLSVAVQCFFCRLAQGILGGRVAEVSGHGVAGRLCGLGGDWGSGGVI